MLKGWLLLLKGETMFVKNITYTDYNGVERKEEFLFQYNKAEIMRWNLMTEGGLRAYIEKITNSKDQTKLVELFQRLIDESYGVKSDDGRRFIKSKELLEEFKQTEAYSEFYMELVTNVDVATAFVNGIIPKLDNEKRA